MFNKKCSIATSVITFCLFSFSINAETAPMFFGIPVAGDMNTAKINGFGDCEQSTYSGIICTKKGEFILAGETMKYLQIQLEQNGTYKGIYAEWDNQKQVNFESVLVKDGWIGNSNRSPEFYKPDSQIKITINTLVSDLPKIEISAAEQYAKEQTLKEAAIRAARAAKTNAALEFMNK